MVGKISGFVDGFFLIASGGGEGSFDAFFADFLRDAFAACGVEAGGIGAFGVGVFACGDELFEAGEKYPVGFGCAVELVEAALCAGVAGCTNRSGENEQSVAVAVGADAFEVEIVAGAFAFGPQPLFAA